MLPPNPWSRLPTHPSTQYPTNLGTHWGEGGGTTPAEVGWEPDGGEGTTPSTKLRGGVAGGDTYTAVISLWGTEGDKRVADREQLFT